MITPLSDKTCRLMFNYTVLRMYLRYCIRGSESNTGTSAQRARCRGSYQTLCLPRQCVRTRCCSIRDHGQGAVARSCNSLSVEFGAWGRGQHYIPLSRPDQSREQFWSPRPRQCWGHWQPKQHGYGGKSEAGPAGRRRSCKIGRCGRQLR